MDLTIVIVSFNTKQYTRQCIQSLLDHTSGLKYEIIVVDNASTDGSVIELRKLAKKKIINLLVNNKNLGFAHGNNQGMRLAKGKFILFLNSDTLVGPKVLNEIFVWMLKHKRVGIVSCQLLNSDGTVQGTGGYFPTLMRVLTWMTIQDLPFVDRLIKPFHPMKSKALFKGTSFFNKRRELDWLTGAFLFVRREVLDSGVVWDEDYFMYGEDVDFCYQAKAANWKVVYVSDWSITHFGGTSSTREFSTINEFKGIKRFFRKHYPGWQYFPMRMILKFGILLRMLVFGIIEGKESARIYEKAFREI